MVRIVDSEHVSAHLSTTYLYCAVLFFFLFFLGVVASIMSVSLTCNLLSCSIYRVYVQVLKVVMCVLSMFDKMMCVGRVWVTLNLYTRTYPDFCWSLTDEWSLGP